MGYRPLLPHIIWLDRYPFEFPANQQQCSSLISTYVCQFAKLTGDTWSTLSFLTISLSLNILLTLMVVIRLILLARSTRTAMGVSGIGGLCRAIIAMLVESCALYGVSSLLVIGPSAARNLVTGFFWCIFPQVQVRAFPDPDLRTDFLM